MLASLILAACAAAFAAVLALVVVTREHRSLAKACFSAGMLLFATQSALTVLTLSTNSPERLLTWQSTAWVAKAFLPGVWLCFSLIYSRGNSGEFLAKWRVPLLIAGAAPLLIAVLFPFQLLTLVITDEGKGQPWLAFTTVGKLLNGVLLVSAVLILTNLEKTFRAAVGTMQWRIKFLILGLGVIFGVEIYTRTQVLLFSGLSLDTLVLEAGALVIGCTLICIGYLRRGFAGVEVYPSRAVLQSSVTVLLVGGYLFILGVLAQLAAMAGGVASFQLKALLLLLGIVALAILLLSRRVRQGIARAVSQHFKRPEHDAYRVWTGLTNALARERGKPELSAAAGKLVSETFSALSVTIWLADEATGALEPVYSTVGQQTQVDERSPAGAPLYTVPPLPTAASGPFDLEAEGGEWAARLREINPSLFHRGGSRICVPLLAGDRTLGAMILADRVNGIPYSAEEMNLLKCIGDQVAAALLNFRLAEELLAAKELEALQTMSTFFVHDLKNAASGLNLILKNLPVHFDNPEFRADALRAVGNTVTRIGKLTERLGILRHNIELRLANCQLNELVCGVIESLNGIPDVVLEKELRTIPEITGDPEQLQTVVTNLLLNARDAVASGGKIHVATEASNGSAVLTISDNGCGMSPEFLRKSLFRPFATTKKKGMGIGMFQSRMIIEAHRGTLVAESTQGAGSTFRVTLPLKPNS